MKTNFVKLFLLAIIFWTPNLVNAESACSYSEQAELNDIVANVKATYEIVEVYNGKILDIDNPNEDGTFPEIDKYTKNFKISILNITDDIYVKVSNDDDTEVKTFKASDAVDGVVSFQTSKKYAMVTYTIEIFANKYSCIGESFRKITLTTPMYNHYSKNNLCQENPDFYYCQEFISTENISLDDFKNRVAEYQQAKEKEHEAQLEKENKNFWERIKEFYNNNTLIVNGVIVIIIAMGVATTVILVKKKRSRVL